MYEQLSFEEAMDFLRERTRFGINLGLRRIEKLLAKMGNPHQKQVKYIHIGGTNGKGSTLAYLAKILQYAGYRVGTFISPHLHHYTERMRINGQDIPQQKVAKLVSDIKPLLEEMEAEGCEPPTEFEVNTAMALQYFTDEQVDYALLEVGMGGAIDSTNVIVPELSIITNVAMDHMDYIGKTITEIAQTKSGIIKEKKPIITGSRHSDALRVLREKAAACHAPLFIQGEDFDWESRKKNGCCQEAEFVYPKGRIPFAIKMLGRYQLDNCVLAMMAAKCLGISNDYLISRAVFDTVWPGRLEIISENPLIILDGAHNTAGMASLAEALQEYWPDHKIVAVLGMLADKERKQALKQLLPLIQEAIITKVPCTRAGNWKRLAEICEEYRVPCQTVEMVDEACTAGMAALTEILEPNKLLLVTGSLYMIADARAYLLQEYHADY